VAGDLRGLLRGAVEQCLDRNHDLHLDVHRTSESLPGDPFDEGVGDDLSSPSGQGLRAHRQLIRGLHQGGVAGHGLLDR
jgi:hypothetical protein